MDARRALLQVRNRWFAIILQLHWLSRVIFPDKIVTLCDFFFAELILPITLHDGAFP